MNEKQYFAMLSILILPSLIGKIAERLAIGEEEATERLYHSEFYEKLSDERLKLWHYSPVMLCDMFVEAERTGIIPYPEET